MPNWTGGVLTAKGRALQAKVEAGQTLELTKMKLGSGTPEPEEIDNLTDLKQPQNIMGISSKTVENNICEVTSVILTSNINTPFYAREWGLFAKDPDEGEILYMYTTDPNPDYIPDKNSALVISASYALNIAVLNVDNIVANIDPEGLITAGILEEELKKYLPLSGGTLTGNLNASGHNITADKFIGNADSADKLGTSTVGSATKPVYINNGVASAVSVDLSTLAPKASPELTGTPTAPTTEIDTNNTQIATTQFVQSLINSKGTISGGSINNSGWERHSNGLLIAWGNGKANSNFNFPITFNNVFVVAGTEGLNASGFSSVSFSRVNNNGGYIYSSSPGEAVINYIAFGN